MEDKSGQTKTELLKLAGILGATERQFDRWRQADLIPPPCGGRSLGRPKGSVSIYPAHTDKQLRRLCELHFGTPATKRERRLLVLAWKLWWEDHDVSASRVRQFLIKHVTTKIDRQAEELRAATAEEREEAVRKLATKPLGRHPGQLAKTRQHLRGQTPQFFDLVFGGVDGALPGDAESKRLLEKGAGMGRMRSDTLLGEQLLSDDVDYLPTMQAGLEMLDGTLTAQVEQMSNDDLCQARQVVRDFFEALSGFAQFAREAKGKGGLGMGDFLYPPETPEEQGMYLLMLHGFGKLAEATAEVGDPAQVVPILEQLTEPYQLAQEVRKVEPYRDLFSTDALLESASDPRKHAEHVREVRRVGLYDPEALEAAREVVEKAKKNTSHDEDDKT